jgi:hypothetical protein
MRDHVHFLSSFKQRITVPPVHTLLLSTATVFLAGNYRSRCTHVASVLYNTLSSRELPFPLYTRCFCPLQQSFKQGITVPAAHTLLLYVATVLQTVNYRSRCTHIVSVHCNTLSSRELPFPLYTCCFCPLQQSF